MRYENNPMKTQLKLVSCFAVIAIACGGFCLSALVRAQSATFTEAGATPDPDANKKEAPASAPTSPSPTPSATPRR